MHIKKVFKGLISSSLTFIVILTTLLMYFTTETERGFGEIRLTVLEFHTFMKKKVTLPRIFTETSSTDVSSACNSYLFLHN